MAGSDTHSEGETAYQKKPSSGTPKESGEWVGRVTLGEEHLNKKSLKDGSPGEKSSRSHRTGSAGVHLLRPYIPPRNHRI